MQSFFVENIKFFVENFKFCIIILISSSNKTIFISSVFFLFFSFLAKVVFILSFKYSLEDFNFQNIHSKKKLFDLLRKHDIESSEFCMHTANLNVAIAKELGIANNDTLYLYFQCGLFHDIGKLGMSFDFLNYQDSYTVQMYGEMKKHSSGGAFILDKVNVEKELIETAKYHHCNFDGSGYPGGLYGNEIPLHARITRVADSVDAYMSRRCYKEGGPANEVLDDVEQYIGTSYDPQIIEVFGVIHRNVMKQCHINGFDRPSKSIYMHYLNELYGENFEERFLSEK